MRTYDIQIESHNFAPAVAIVVEANAIAVSVAVFRTQRRNPKFPYANCVVILHVTICTFCVNTLRCLPLVHIFLRICHRRL